MKVIPAPIKAIVRFEIVNAIRPTAKAATIPVRLATERII